MTEINFKDLPIPAYFTWDGTHYQKMSKRVWYYYRKNNKK